MLIEYHRFWLDQKNRMFMLIFAQKAQKTKILTLSSFSFLFFWFVFLFFFPFFFYLWGTGDIALVSGAIHLYYRWHKNFVCVPVNAFVAFTNKLCYYGFFDFDKMRIVGAPWNVCCLCCCCSIIKSISLFLYVMRYPLFLLKANERKRDWHKMISICWVEGGGPAKKKTNDMVKCANIQVILMVMSE